MSPGRIMTYLTPMKRVSLRCMIFTSEVSLRKWVWRPWLFCELSSKNQSGYITLDFYFVLDWYKLIPELILHRTLEVTQESYTNLWLYLLSGTRNPTVCRCQIPPCEINERSWCIISWRERESCQPNSGIDFVSSVLIGCETLDLFVNALLNVNVNQRVTSLPPRLEF